MFSPQPAARFQGEPGVVRDEIHLGVVEQRVLVQVRRSDRHPGIVDDADLGVDIDRPVRFPTDRVECARQQPALVAVGLNQRSELASGIIAAVLGFRR